MIKKSKKIILILLITIGLAMGFDGNVFASSITVSPSKTIVSAGEKFNVTITGNDATGRANINISNGTASKSSVWLDNDSQTIQVTAGGSGTINISVSGEVSDSSGNDKEISSSSSVSIKAEEENHDNGNAGSEDNESQNNSGTSSNNSGSSSSGNTNTGKSNNAKLSNLIVTPVDFKGFKASKTSGYSVTVENDVTEVGIKASTQDSKAKVEISGNKDLKVGDNTVSIQVTAEDGTQKTYTVKVTRKAEKTDGNDAKETTADPADDKTDETKDTENKANETEQEVLGITSLKLIPEFKTDVYEYKVTVPVDIESLDVKVECNIPNAEIEIMGNKDLIVGENVITILVKSPNGDQKSYQIIVNKTEETLNLDNNTQLIKNIIIGTIIVILVVAMVISILIYRSGRKDEKEDTIGKSTKIADEIIEDKENNENKEEIKRKYLENFEGEKKDSFDGRKNGKRFK